MECPCENCITLSICRSIQLSERKDDLFKYIVNPHVLKKCVLIREYTGYNPDTLKGMTHSADRLARSRRVLEYETTTSM